MGQGGDDSPRRNQSGLGDVPLLLVSWVISLYALKLWEERKLIAKCITSGISSLLSHACR